MIKLITFDVVGTLVKFRGHVTERYSHVARKFGLDVDSEKINKGFRIAFKDINKRYPIFGANSKIASEDWWRMLVKNTFITAGESLH